MAPLVHDLSARWQKIQCTLSMNRSNVHVRLSITDNDDIIVHLHTCPEHAVWSLCNHDTMLIQMYWAKAYIIYHKRLICIILCRISESYTNHRTKSLTVIGWWSHGKRTHRIAGLEIWHLFRLHFSVHTRVSLIHILRGVYCFCCCTFTFCCDVSKVWSYNIF